MSCASNENTIPKCQYCEVKDSCFYLTFRFNNTCDTCTNHEIQQSNQYICSLSCDNLYYDIDYGTYLIEPTPINNYKMKAELLCEKDDCFYCGKRITYTVITEGYQIQPLPQNELQKKIDLFINQKLVLDDTSRTSISDIIYNYKIFFNIDTRKMSNKKRKDFNRHLRREFEKILHIDNSSRGYTSYKLI